MEKLYSLGTKYAACEHLKRTEADFIPGDELDESFARDYRVLPLFEVKVFDFAHRNHYSLRNNEFLACRWREYIVASCGKQRTPVNFPRTKDFHFYKYHTRFEPNQTIDHFPHFRHQMKPGPGIDSIGQMPIPADMHSPRATGAPRKKSAKMRSKMKKNKKK